MRRSVWTWSVAVLVTALIAGAAGWAAATIFRPVHDTLEATTYTLASVESGEVGASLNLNTIAKWTSSPAGANQAVGTVTSVAITDGAEVSQGAELYSVNLDPVVVAAGEIPAFRAVSNGVEGADVAQLQTMLRDLGFYRGPVDGKAQAGTDRAIRAWQKSLGLPETGVVDIGDVIFLPSLPSRVSLDSEVIARGRAVAGGEQVVRVLPAAPDFVVPLTDSQAQRVPAGTAVEISAPDGAIWQAVAAEQTRDEESQTVRVHLTSAGEGLVCADACGLVPVTGETSLPSRVVTVPIVTGLVVPSAALVSDVSGEVAVIDETGDSHPVTVIAAASGMSVIEGVEEGLRVRIPGEAAGQE